MTPTQGIPALRVVEDEATDKTYALVEVSGPHPARQQPSGPIAVIPPVPRGVISEATAKKMLRAMLDDGRVASTGTPPALLLAGILAVATIVVIVSLAWRAWG
ncbi:MAG: hypothetical protein JSV86_10380 [Gemmatimonadota bacterium]|nr:MAG: hypothetical protein JSV86_10380 [Gemmatimonadota bacterium]